MTIDSAPARHSVSARRTGRRRWWVAIRAAVASAIFAATAIVIPAPVIAHPGAPAGVFDRDSVGWRYVTDRSKANFDQVCEDYAEQGFMVVDVDVADFVANSDGHGAVFQRNTDNRRWRVRTGMTEAQFTSEHASATGANLRLVDYERYTPTVDSSVRLAAVWVENREGLSTAFRSNMTSAQLDTYLDQQVAAGRMPVNIEPYRAGSSFRYAAIFLQNTQGLAWQMWWGLTNSQFTSKFNELRDDYRMLHVASALHVESAARYSGIWIENRNGRGWAEYRNLTHEELGDRVDELSGQRMITYTRYVYGIAVEPGDPEVVHVFYRYAAVWRQNN
jgi:hypothetical protein